MAFLLGCEKVGVDFPSKTVFDEISLGVNDGERIGIVGRNGDGKSTLLALLGGLLEPDRGRVIRTNNISVGVLAQVDELSDDDTVGRAIVGDLPEYEWASSARIRGIIAGIVARFRAVRGAVSIWRGCSWVTGTSSCSTSPRTIWTCAQSTGWHSI